MIASSADVKACFLLTIYVLVNQLCTMMILEDPTSIRYIYGNSIYYNQSSIYARFNKRNLNLYMNILLSYRHNRGLNGKSVTRKKEHSKDKQVNLDINGLVHVLVT